MVATGESHVNGTEDVAYITVYFANNVIAHFNVNWLSPVKVRTTLIGGEKKMLVWNDLEPDEKIKIYDKGVTKSNGEGRYELLVSYRMGDIWAPRIEQIEALRVETQYFVDCIEKDERLQRRGRGPAGGADAGGHGCVAQRTEEAWCTYERLPVHRSRRQAGPGRQAVEVHQSLRLQRSATTPRSAPSWRSRRTPSVGNNCKISSHTFICEGVTIEDDVFIGHSVTFINDLYPRATAGGQLQTEADWKVEPTLVRKGASIGSGSNNPGQGHDRRKRHRRRRQRGHPRRPGQRDRRRQSRPHPPLPRQEESSVLAASRRPLEIPGILRALEVVMKVPFLDLVTPHVELEEEILAVVRGRSAHGSFRRRPRGRGLRKRIRRSSAATEPLRRGQQRHRRPPLRPDGRRHRQRRSSSSRSRTPSSRRRKRSPRPAPRPTSSTSTSAPTTWTRRCSANTWRRDSTVVKAVIPVHLYGQMADMDPILELAEQYNLVVIEDACQAHGAEYFSRRHQRWFRAGSMGRAAAFSFYPGKNLGACGEGGAVTTNDARDRDRRSACCATTASRRSTTTRWKATTAAWTAIQCGILRVKLRHLESWNEQRRQAAARYAEVRHWGRLPVRARLVPCGLPPLRRPHARIATPSRSTWTRPASVPASTTPSPCTSKMHMRQDLSHPIRSRRESLPKFFLCRCRPI